MNTDTSFTPTPTSVDPNRTTPTLDAKDMLNTTPTLDAKASHAHENPNESKTTARGHGRGIPDEAEAKGTAYDADTAAETAEIANIYREIAARAFKACIDRQQKALNALKLAYDTFETVSGDLQRLNTGYPDGGPPEELEAYNEVLSAQDAHEAASAYSDAMYRFAYAAIEALGIL